MNDFSKNTMQLGANNNLIETQDIHRSLSKLPIVSEFKERFFFQILSYS